MLTSLLQQAAPAAPNALMQFAPIIFIFVIIQVEIFIDYFFIDS